MDFLNGATSEVPVRIIFFLTFLTFIPGLLLAMTAFLRILLVLGFIRHALGLAQMPPNQVLVGLSLFFTYFVMGPTLETSYRDGVDPYLKGELAGEVALERAGAPLRKFMLSQTREKDLILMGNLARSVEWEKPDDIPFRVIVPSFVVSELRSAFSIGFLLFIPFLVVDLAIAALLNALGMIMLPPTAISLPFKLLIFVLADGWALVVGAVVRSFGVA